MERPAVKAKNLSQTVSYQSPDVMPGLVELLISIQHIWMALMLAKRSGAYASNSLGVLSLLGHHNKTNCQKPTVRMR